MTRGHEVHAYMNTDCQSTHQLAKAGIIMHTYSNNEGCLLENTPFLERYGNLSIEKLTILHKIIEGISFVNFVQTEVEAFLNDQDVFEGLTFDLCIVDEMYPTTFMRILPYKLDIPTASIIIDFDPSKAGVPGLPSFTPFIIFSRLTNEMTFIERVKNMLFVTVLDTLLCKVLPLKSDTLVSRFAPNRPYLTLAQIQRKTKLWLVQSDVTLDYPQVRMPHVINIGGLNTRPAEPLPIEIQSIADEAKDGLIIVSFGTFLASSQQIKNNLFEAFKKLNQTVIWKFTGIMEEPVPTHIHLMKWIPQNDLLAHPNTKLFITHCGSNSQFEALYHGIPMLGLPITEEQIHNSLRMAKKQLGIHMNSHTLEPKELLFAINELLTNETYKNKMARQSTIFKDKPMTPMETLVYWVEHVMKYGSDHLISPAIHMPWYTYWCIDVAGFLVCVCFMVLYSVSLLFKIIFRCLKHICRRSKVKQF